MMKKKIRKKKIPRLHSSNFFIDCGFSLVWIWAFVALCRRTCIGRAAHWRITILNLRQRAMPHAIPRCPLSSSVFLIFIVDYPCWRHLQVEPRCNCRKNLWVQGFVCSWPNVHFTPIWCEYFIVLICKTEVRWVSFQGRKKCCSIMRNDPGLLSIKFCYSYDMYFQIDWFHEISQ